MFLSTGHVGYYSVCAKNRDVQLTLNNQCAHTTYPSYHQLAKGWGVGNKNLQTNTLAIESSITPRVRQKSELQIQKSSVASPESLLSKASYVNRYVQVQLPGSSAHTLCRDSAQSRARSQSTSPFGIALQLGAKLCIPQYHPHAIAVDTAWPTMAYLGIRPKRCTSALCHYKIRYFLTIMQLLFSKQGQWVLT